MASPRLQSQLYRRVSAGLFGALTACSLLLHTPAFALDAVPPSGYDTLRGEPFFLLSDASFGSDAVAQVRLEVPGRDRSPDLQRYGGADIVVYRVPNPLAFLKGQKNLHRVEVEGKYAGEGLANTLNYLWDTWYKQSRRSWQRVLSTPARTKATEKAPQLKLGANIKATSAFENNLQFKPLPGFTLVSRFRYPLWQAKTIAPPKEVKLDGSSSEFIAQSDGNVMVPVGKLAPGLYLVEAIIGAHRANTLLFVTDTVAITKNAGEQMLVWTAHRQTGQAVPGVSVAWSDGTGVLQSGVTSSDGVITLNHASPEHTFVMGQDAKGGVFVSENFYYDSEIYNAKLYAVTDRPLYRPGDEVRLKIVGREFKSARISNPVADGDIKLSIFDPNGTPVATQSLKFLSQTGADTQFKLPSNATAGGYNVQFSYGDDIYSAAFRVAEYIKPHFDINLVMDKPEYKTGEPIEGKIQLSYPDGKPVKEADVTLTVRAQQSTMVEGELQYAGLFPIKLDQQALKTNADGVAKISLPPAKDPSRYVFTLFANDGAAYRVKVTRELLIQRGSNPYKITAAKHFSQPNESVVFNLKAQGSGGTPPAQWEIVRLESQTRLSGTLPAAATQWPVRFAQAGSYTVNVKDASGNLLGAISHWVAGDGLKATPGSVEIVFDKDTYQPGEMAEALITFPQPVATALLTLERDAVEHYSLLKGADWVSTSKVAPNQWRARIKVEESYSPNMTFSVLYTRAGDYVFQNAGIKVVQPEIALSFKTPKAVYAPGETVAVDVTSSLAGKPVPANLTVGVVDEMVYVLQPEIAPSIADFFYHPRRNNVRTTASLSFISYDMARSALPGNTSTTRYNERGVKVLERPRRDEVDTASWQPTLKTDATGHAQFSFVMPDSLTRWRITGRAMTDEGLVGQKTAYVRSEKPLYVKWTGPTHYREQDQPMIDFVVFNRTDREQTVAWNAKGAGLSQTQSLVLKRGANYVSVPLTKAVEGPIVTQVKLAGKVIDSVITSLHVDPLNWASPRSVMVPVNGPTLTIPVPADAKNVRLSFASGAASQFGRVVDELIDYPYGCVEQTASRLIPLAMAQQVLDDNRNAGVGQLLQTQRLRLVQLAGADGVFGWWGYPTEDSLFLSAYAYYADWYAGRSLNLNLPAEHWQYLFEIYKKHGEKTPLLHRALVLWWMNEMGLPVQNLLQGLDAALVRAAYPAAKLGKNDSLIWAAPDSAEGLQFALILSSQLHTQLGEALPTALAGPLAQAIEANRESPSLAVQSALLMTKQAKPGVDANSILTQVSSTMPTMERALALVWLQKAMGGVPAGKPMGIKPIGAWQQVVSQGGVSQWVLPGGSVVAPTVQLSGTGVPATAVLRYESSALETAKLPIQVTRRLFKLVQTDTALKFKAEPVKAGEALQSNALYVDEIELTPPAKSQFRFGLLEVPLPPGGEVEGTTWGMTIIGLPGDGESAAFKRLNHEMGQLSYNLPIESLAKPLITRQLVRFSQRGKFALPATRYFRMYQPGEKAFGKPLSVTVE